MSRVPSEQFAWVPDDINVELPSAARVYDYLLGGGHNFAADRAVGEKVFRALPNGRQIASSNRAFLRRAVLHMVDQGITQFLDLGSGIPTVGNVHEVAQAADPMCRVVYVDNDEVAVAHSQLILEGNENATVVAADLCQPATVLSAPAVQRLLDLDATERDAASWVVPRIHEEAEFDTTRHTTRTRPSAESLVQPGRSAPPEPATTQIMSRVRRARCESRTRRGHGPGARRRVSRKTAARGSR